MSAPTLVAARDRTGNWRARSACADVDPEDFVLPGDPSAVTAGDHTAQVNAAKAVCAGCEVRTDCLTWAVETEEGRNTGQWTVLGGLEPKELKAVIRANARARKNLNARVASAS